MDVEEMDKELKLEIIWFAMETIASSMVISKLKVIIGTH